MTFFLELMTEVMVLRDRQDTIESACSTRRSVISREDINGYIPDGDVEAEPDRANGPHSSPVCLRNPRARRPRGRLKTEIQPPGTDIRAACFTLKKPRFSFSYNI